MTHDELLAKIDYWFDTDNFHLQKNALRAVVELHKPITTPNNFSYCPECQYGHARGVYPCQTIQAIEKELN
jgi:hypothetical protein